MIETYILYTAILVLAASFAYIAQYGSDASQRMWGRIFCFMCLFIPAALRYGIGTDYGSFCMVYDNNFPYYMQKWEPGFELIGRLCRMLGLSSHMFLVVIAAITYGLICFYAPKKHIFTIITFYILSFIYLSSYNISRQCMATSVLLCGFSLFYDNRKVKGFLLLAVASLIHYSSLVAFPIIAISYLKINTFFRFGLMILCFFLASNQDFLLWLISIAALINERNSLLVLIVEQNTKMKTGISLMIMILPTLLILLNSKRISRCNNGKLILNANAVFFAVAISSAFLAIFARFVPALFFIPLFSIQILYNANKRYAKLYHSLLIALFFVLFTRNIGMNSIYRNDGQVGFRISPYNSIFNKENINE